MEALEGMGDIDGDMGISVMINVDGVVAWRTRCQDGKRPLNSGIRGVGFVAGPTRVVDPI